MLRGGVQDFGDIQYSQKKGRNYFLWDTQRGSGKRGAIHNEVRSVAEGTSANDAKPTTSHIEGTTIEANQNPGRIRLSRVSQDKVDPLPG